MGGRKQTNGERGGGESLIEKIEPRVFRLAPLDSENPQLIHNSSTATNGTSSVFMTHLSRRCQLCCPSARGSSSLLSPRLLPNAFLGFLRCLGSMVRKIFFSFCPIATTAVSAPHYQVHEYSSGSVRYSHIIRSPFHPPLAICLPAHLVQTHCLIRRRRLAPQY